MDWFTLIISILYLCIGIPSVSLGLIKIIRFRKRLNRIDLELTLLTSISGLIISILGIANILKI